MNPVVIVARFSIRRRKWHVARPGHVEVPVGVKAQVRIVKDRRVSLDRERMGVGLLAGIEAERDEMDVVGVVVGDVIDVTTRAVVERDELLRLPSSSNNVAIWRSVAKFRRKAVGPRVGAAPVGTNQEDVTVLVSLNHGGLRAVGPLLDDTERGSSVCAPHQTPLAVGIVVVTQALDVGGEDSVGRGDNLLVVGLEDAVAGGVEVEREN